MFLIAQQEDFVLWLKPYELNRREYIYHISIFYNFVKHNYLHKKRDAPKYAP